MAGTIPGSNIQSAGPISGDISIDSGSNTTGNAPTALPPEAIATLDTNAVEIAVIDPGDSSDAPPAIFLTQADLDVNANHEVSADQSHGTTPTATATATAYVEVDGDAPH